MDGQTTEKTAAPPRLELLECECGSRFFLELHPIFVGEARTPDEPIGTPTRQCPGCGAIWQLLDVGWMRVVVGRNLQALRRISAELANAAEIG